MDVTRITVTRADVREGEQGNACLCPIALAIARAAHLGPGQLWVADDYIKVYEPGITWFAETPADAAEFIRAFDGEGATPAMLNAVLTFELAWQEGTDVDA